MGSLCFGFDRDCTGFCGSFGGFLLLLCSFPTKQGIQIYGSKIGETLQTKKDGVFLALGVEERLW